MRVIRGVRPYVGAKKWKKIAGKIGGDVPKACGKSDGTLNVNHGMEEARSSGPA